MNHIDGLRCALPSGAFYVFPNIHRLQRPSAEVASRLLNEAGIACLAGTAFGAYGESYLRFSYASSEENIRKMLRILATFIKDMLP
jgi:aspartate/methionine/tyrosine aminotransferase